MPLQTRQWQHSVQTRPTHTVAEHGIGRHVCAAELVSLAPSQKAMYNPPLIISTRQRPAKVQRLGWKQLHWGQHLGRLKCLGRCCGSLCQTGSASFAVQNMAVPAVLELPLGGSRPRRGSARLPLLVQHLRRPTTCQVDASLAALHRAVQARYPKHCCTSSLVYVYQAPVQCFHDTYPALLEQRRLCASAAQLINRFISTSVSSSADAAQHASSAQAWPTLELCLPQLASLPSLAQCAEVHTCQQVVERGKWVSIKARGAGRAAAVQSDLPERSLAAYLALPVEEYSLLDPDWVERCGRSTACWLTVCDMHTHSTREVASTLTAAIVS